MSSITVGIDISKEKIDVSILLEDKIIRHEELTNKRQGFEKLWHILKKFKEVSVGFESTGSYGKNLSHFLCEKGFKVYLLNPIQVKYYIKSKMKRVKTDKSDSALIAQFVSLHKEELIPFKQKSKTFLKVKNVQRCLYALKEDRKQIKCRIEAFSQSDEDGNDFALNVFESQLTYVEKKIEETEKSIKQDILNDQEVKEIYERLLTIPGIGEISAIGLIAELPDLEHFKCAKQLAAYAGLNPGIYESGSSVRRQSGISKCGNKHLRTLLYMPSLYLKNRSSALTNFVQRLQERGKKPKVIVVAVMHKLLRIIFGVLKKGKDFDESYVI